ncbi:hypothetical protein EDD18DRAFT_1177812 [Armillaria luteobubalina]|uniref:Heterokaryon incompatibility domain-containing protein n=1 Tax=Armillaria luteobubalina TaxID=153913 RepID=A0AA39UV32_9AGAR|nr:hypothetical protein EDD18DRAFT_1177812 [Armillaria luteobubalina]
MDEAEWLRRYRDDIVTFEAGQTEHTHRNYELLPLVTLSAFAKTGQTESSIPVPNQRFYTGRKPIIPSSLAGTSCVDLGVEGVLERLNITLGTSYTLLTPSVSSLLAVGISKKQDFGTAYARLRSIWYEDLTTAEDNLRVCEVWDLEMRQDIVLNNKITNSYMPPRRCWDLYSNQVVPWWLARQGTLAISHTWVNEKDWLGVLTPINGFEWPVPIPNDTNIDLICIEMLNLGAEYAWLDVLCLRQAGGWRDDRRAQEWRVDVPTIGHVYLTASRVVCYFSGLGRPLIIKPGDFESDRSWFRRAWTLQEICEDPIIAGDTGLTHIPVFAVLSHMQNRCSTNPVDKVAGLGYLLWSGEIPAYYETQSEEDAWMALVAVMSPLNQAQLLFMYPRPGDGSRIWRLSWRQAMTEKLPSHDSRSLVGYVWRDESKGADRYDGPLIESGHLQGLGDGDAKGQPRWGKLIVKDTKETKHTFKIVAYHQHPIPEGSYVLLGSEPLYDNRVHQQYWAVGTRSSEQVFRKVSVFYIPDIEEVRRLIDLGVAKDSPILLA